MSRAWRVEINNPLRATPFSLISNDNLQTMMKRIERFQNQLAYLRKTETNPANYHASASGFIAEIDRMQLEALEYLSLHPAEIQIAA